MKKILFPLFLLLFLSPLAAQENIRVDHYNLKWYLDVDEATTISKETGKPIFLYFTGSDWCGACKMLEEKYFSTKQFQKYAQNFVLIEVDFIKKTFDKEFLFANEKEWRPKFDLKENYKVKGFPTTVFLASDGTVKGKLEGYLGDNTKKEYRKMIKEVLFDSGKK